MTLVEAARLAALQEMRRDPRVWVLGEDVARGGLFGQYRGFLEEFGAQRVVSTPISESTIMGAGLGAALVGTRPIIEMRIFDFVMCAMDELVNQIARSATCSAARRARRGGADAARHLAELRGPAQPDAGRLVHPTSRASSSPRLRRPRTRRGCSSRPSGPMTRCCSSTRRTFFPSRGRSRR
jgi:pyruvate dehydrogenase E1 component beta subunit